MCHYTFCAVFFLSSIWLFGQTNYPPNSVPYNDNPTNWVYDCEFLGYNNMNPAATNLPCGWYDEPTNILTSSSGYYSILSATNLQLQMLSAYPVLFAGQVREQCDLLVSNAVPGTLVEVFGTTNLSVPFVEISSYYAASLSDLVSVLPPNSGGKSGTIPSEYFIRVFGVQYVPPVYYRVTRTVPVGHEPYVLVSCGVLTAICLANSLKHSF